jgi:hypothetical protein
MAILWVIAKSLFFLSLAPAVFVLVGLPLLLLSERIKILWTDRLAAERDGFVSLAGLGG